MSNNKDIQKHAEDFWVYCDFGRVVKFLDKIYPLIPTLRDKINFWKQNGCYIYPEPKALPNSKE